ncbi:MAG: FkbM family methyltransferase, partial [Candidatus Omnitrophota bacterium]
DFFFIQIGSCDGVKRDLIHGHILKYNWSGILVEPVRYLFQRLIKNYHGEKNLIFENIAVSREGGYRDFYYLRETNDPMPSWYDEIGSFFKDNVLKHEFAIPNIEKYIVSEKVKTITFTDLIRKYKVKKIDLLHIDAEGYDYEILKLINFKDIKPGMILFEHRHLCDGDCKKSKSLLRENGYLFCKAGINIFAYQPFSFLEQLKVIFVILPVELIQRFVEKYRSKVSIQRNTSVYGEI